MPPAQEELQQARRSLKVITGPSQAAAAAAAAAAEEPKQQGAAGAAAGAAAAAGGGAGGSGGGESGSGGEGSGGGGSMAENVRSSDFLKKFFQVRTDREGEGRKVFWRSGVGVWRVLGVCGRRLQL